MTSQRYFEHHFLRPILDGNIEVLQQRLNDLTPSDLRELLEFYFDHNSIEGIEAVVKVLPCGDYANEVVRLSYSDTTRGLNAFDRLLEKTTSDKSKLYERCIFGEGHPHCIAALRTHYNPDDTEKTIALMKWLIAHDQMKSWEDLLMLYQNSRWPNEPEYLDFIIDEMVSSRWDDWNSDEDKGKALRAFIAQSDPNRSYNFPGLLIKEYGQRYDPIVFDVIQELPQSVDIHNVYGAPLRWAVIEKCGDVFDHFYDLSTGEQRADIYAHLDPDLKTRWDHWETGIVKKRLEAVVDEGCTPPKRKI